jgi:hypothetical protein
MPTAKEFGCAELITNPPPILDRIREETCADDHDMAYWGGIGATCRRCGRVEIDGEFYGYDDKNGLWGA